MSTELQPQTLTTYRDYSPEFKSAAIAAYEANNCNLTSTAKELGIPFQTLDYWLKSIDRHSDFQNKSKADLASQYEQIAYKVAGIARETLDDPERARKIPFAALMTGGAVATDKMLVLRSQPTSITLSVERTEISVILQQSLAQLEDE